MKRKTVLFAVVIFLLLISPLNAATLWVNPAGSNTSPYDTKSKGATSATTVISAMSGGDTLYYATGTYTSDNDRIRGLPSGTDRDHLTTVQCETDFGCVLSGMTVGTGAVTEEAVIAAYEKEYLYIRGFLVKDPVVASEYGLASVEIYGDIATSSRTVILKNIGVRNGASSANTRYGGGVEFYNISYGLLEDVFVVGSMRYGINVSGGANNHHNILRRCVVRWDYGYSGSGIQPRASIVSYGGYASYTNADADAQADGRLPSEYILMHNCIVVDGNNGDEGSGTFIGGYSVPHETSNVHRRGCISLNNFGYGYHSSEDSLSHDNTSTHCIDWDSSSGWYWKALASGASGIYYCTAENVDVQCPSGGSGFTCVAENTAAIGTVNYNYTTSTSGNVVSTSYQYIVQSPEADAGADILYKWGTDGTIWGEAGYDTLSGTSLWPYPNEDAIKTLFSETNNPPESGAYPATNDVTRGFTTGTSIGGGSQTLTKYIWEYLGNEIPCDVYGTCDEAAPTTVITTSSPQAIAGDSLTVTGTCTDDVACIATKCRIASEPDANNGTACTGTASWTCAGLSGFSEGANTLYCESFDAAGNYDSGNSITVNYTLPVASGKASVSQVAGGARMEQVAGAAAVQ
ncbi:MAG: hypothetical protein V2B18_21330 [Pseudomonadota bacterium]